VTILRSGAGGSDDYLVIDALLSPRYLGQTDPNRDTGNDVGSAAVIFVTNAMAATASFGLRWRPIEGACVRT
jgi:hypothetical protein